MPKVNMTKVESGGDFAPVPPGVYAARVRSVEKGSTKPQADQSSNELWTLEIELLAGPEGAEDPTFQGRKVWDRITWSEKGLSRVKLVLKALGFDVETDEEIDWMPEHLVNRGARVEVVIGEWNGRKRNEIPFAGWMEIDSAVATSATIPDDDIPF
jgi:hypothetical protein